MKVSLLHTYLPDILARYHTVLEKLMYILYYVPASFQIEQISSYKAPIIFMHFLVKLVFPQRMSTGSTKSIYVYMQQATKYRFGFQPGTTGVLVKFFI